MKQTPVFAIARSSSARKGDTQLKITSSVLRAAAHRGSMSSTFNHTMKRPMTSMMKPQQRETYYSKICVGLFKVS